MWKGKSLESLDCLQRWDRPVAPVQLRRKVKMNIKDALKQYRFVLIEIKDLNRRMESEPEIADIFERELKELYAIQKQTEDFIAAIEAPFTRQLFVMRYCLGMQHKVIAARLAAEGAGKYSADNIRIILKRYIEKATRKE